MLVSAALVLIDGPGLAWRSFMAERVRHKNVPGHHDCKASPLMALDHPSSGRWWATALWLRRQRAPSIGNFQVIAMFARRRRGSERPITPPPIPQADLHGPTS